jgi:hypothetical protein
MKALGIVTAYFNIEKIQTANGIHHNNSLLMTKTRKTHLSRTLNDISIVQNNRTGMANK